MAEAGGCGGGGSASGELVGIAIGTVAQFLISLGLCGMKWAHKRNAALPAAARSSRYVVAAFSLNALGGLLNGVALSLASQSEIGALGTLVLVGNCIFAPRLLGEVVGPREVRGTLVILLSTVVVVLSGPHCEVDFDSALLLFLLIRPLHLAFALLTALLIGGSWSLVIRAEAALLAGMRGVSDEDLEAATPLSASSEQHNPLRLSVDRQLSADLAEDRTSSLQSSSPPTSPIADSAGWDDLLDARREEQYELRSVSGRRLAAAHISTCAAFSCYNIIFTKIVGEAHRPLFRLRKALQTQAPVGATGELASVDFPSALSAPYVYIFAGCLIVSNTLQVVWLNRCLKRFPALFVIPALQVAQLLYTVIGGGVSASFRPRSVVWKWSQA